MDSKKNVLSLFSGCGGMDLGFEGDFKVPIECVNLKTTDWVKSKGNGFVHLKPTGFSTVFANDILLPAKVAWERYFNKRNTEAKFYDESIVDLVKKAKNGDFSFPSNIDVVTGGFPCQDFSVAGKRFGFKSQRSHNGKKDLGISSSENRGMLYLWMKEVINITRPKVFIAENVKGLLSLGDTKQVIENEFREIGGGYIVPSAQVLFAPDYGVPQRRERVIFIGLRKDALRPEVLRQFELGKISAEINPYPQKTHSYTGTDLKKYTTSSIALKGLLEPDEAKDLSQQIYSKAIYGGNTQGQCEIKLDAPAPTIRSEHHGNIEFRRLSKEHGGTHIDEIDLGLKERRLTVRECARIQTFPDDYEFIIPKTRNRTSLSGSSAYKIIGNAVPPLLAYNIAQRLNAIWDVLFEK